MLAFPRSLPGISISMTFRILTGGIVQPHASGAEGRLSYFVEPLYEVDCQFDALRDGVYKGNFFDELSQIEGLFGVCAGSTFGFSLFNPRANKVAQQPLGTTDATTAGFDLVRTYGPASVPAAQGTEHVGVLDTTQPFNLYIDGSAKPVAPTDPVYGYTLLTTTPVKQQVVFNAAPPAGHTISADFSYLFYARFKESTLEYQRFVENLYKMNTASLRTLRAEGQ